MTKFTDKVIKYNSRLASDLSINDVQASGIWGNIGGETGGFSALQEKKPMVAGSRGGYGWMQWTGPRRKKYEKWCKDKSIDAASDETNYQYLVYETKTDEAHSLAQLKKTTTVASATETFMLQNLRPGKPNFKGRVDWANQAYEAVHAKSKNDSIVKTTSAVVAGTAGTAVVTPHSFWQDHWHWIVGGGITIAVVGVILVLLHHAGIKNEAIKKG